MGLPHAQWHIASVPVSLLLLYCLETRSLTALEPSGYSSPCAPMPSICMAAGLLLIFFKFILCVFHSLYLDPIHSPSLCI